MFDIRNKSKQELPVYIVDKGRLRLVFLLSNEIKSSESMTTSMSSFKKKGLIKVVMRKKKKTKSSLVNKTD